MTWKDPESGYVSITHAGGVLQAVLDDMNMDADLGDGDHMLTLLQMLPEADRLALIVRIAGG